jgi:hypothetical protein
LRKTREQIKEQFHGTLANLSVAEIAVQYPDLAALLWVLGDGSPQGPIEEVEEVEEELSLVPALPSLPPQLTWWQILLNFVHGVT